jgi:hypothetical protein
MEFVDRRQIVRREVLDVLSGRLQRRQDDIAESVGAKVLGKRKWAIVHSTDAFGASGMKYGPY